MRALGLLNDPKQFEQIIVRSNPDGSQVSALGTILEQGLTDRIRCPASEQHNLLLRSDLGIHRLQTHLEHVERGPCGDNHWVASSCDNASSLRTSSACLERFLNFWDGIYR